MKKNILLLLVLSLMVTACSSTKTYEAGKYDDPYQLLESKREQYRRRDEEKRKEEERKAEEERRALEKAKEKEKEKVKTVETETTAEIETVSVEEKVDEDKLKLEEEKRLKKEEAERVKKLPYEERMQYKVNKAMDKINEMVGIANKAREEEISNKAAIDEIEKMLNPQTIEEAEKKQ